LTATRSPAKPPAAAATIIPPVAASMYASNVLPSCYWFGGAVVSSDQRIDVGMTPPLDLGPPRAGLGGGQTIQM
jgi:hypothetical protein